MLSNALPARVETGSEEHSFRPAGWSLSGLRPSFNTPRAPIGKAYRTLIGIGGRFSVDNPVVGGRFSAPPGFGQWAFHRGKVGDSLGMFCPSGRFIVDNSTPAQWVIHRAGSVKLGYPGAKGDRGCATDSQPAGASRSGGDPPSPRGRGRDKARAREAAPTGRGDARPHERLTERGRSFLPAQRPMPDLPSAL